ncbi:polysaccharide pyruvyl transferase family protein [Gimibacter soli]|uniref:Polysaccharide pyruvyl transferase family protein n=1 Tax=Gimibacter soli TaxID=3024400 RepID=A0AAE9XWD6_9PROT|nr:polysaccharide pyruvyl transferase family protein [Gimibacter soli]WCL55668.1 polysaccharide pyruvyl transferase family protein [Gimibacter soli]
MRYLVVGCRWFLDDMDTASMSFDDLMLHSGKNSGNLFIGEALRHHIRRFAPEGSTIDHIRLGLIKETDPAEIAKNYDQIILAGSNMLKATVNFGFLAKFVRETGLPFSIVGAGAQAQHEDEKLTVHEGTLRLFRVAKRSGGISGVRGEYTAKVLRENGIENVEVIGCPTMYLNAGNPDFKVRQPNREQMEKVIISYKLDRKGYDNNDLLQQVQRQMFQDQLARGFHQIVQTNQRDGREAYEKAFSGENQALMRRYFDLPAEQLEALRDTGLNRTHLFFTWKEWRGFFDDADFTFGMRFHGNVMSIMAGVPTLWITHDTRTEELCRTAGFPYVTLDDLGRKGYSFDHMLDLADMSDFNAGYKARCDRFDDFFQRLLIV